MTASRLSRLLVPAGVAALLAACAMPASAQDAAKPAPGCGAVFADPANDNNVTGVGSTDFDSADANLDILNGWFDYDSAKNVVTANLRVTDLNTDFGPDRTGVTWNFTYDVAGKTYFVRAMVDFSGGPFYEYGVYQLPVTSWEPGATPPENPMPLARYAYLGDTEGKFFEGKNGVIQIVVPKAAGGEVGKKLEHPWATGSAARQVVPGPVKQAPTRGVSSPADTAPDGATKSNGGSAFTISSCSPVEELSSDGGGLTDTIQSSAPAQPAAAPPPPSTAPSPQPAAPAIVEGPPALAVRLLTTKAKALAKGKTLTLRLRSAEALNGVAVRLRRGTAVYGTARVARLAGAGALRLKLTRKLAKGAYTLDVAGNDASGRHRTAVAKLTVR